MEYQFESLGPTLRWVALLFLLFFVVAGIAVAAGMAALPGWIAKRRAHPQANAINVCGWLGLPTGILWVVAIVWAYIDGDTTKATTNSENAVATQGNIGRLKEQLAELNDLVTQLEEKQR